MKISRNKIFKNLHFIKGDKLKRPYGFKIVINTMRIYFSPILKEEVFSSSKNKFIMQK